MERACDETDVLRRGLCTLRENEDGFIRIEGMYHLFCSVRTRAMDILITTSPVRRTLRYKRRQWGYLRAIRPPCRRHPGLRRVPLGDAVRRIRNPKYTSPICCLCKGPSILLHQASMAWCRREGHANRHTVRYSHARHSLVTGQLTYG